MLKLSGVSRAQCKLHSQRSRLSQRQSWLALRQSWLTLRQCKLTLRRCKLTLRRCKLTLRQCKLTLRRCKPTLRQCKPALPRGNRSRRHFPTGETTRKPVISTRSQVPMQNPETNAQPSSESHARKPEADGAVHGARHGNRTVLLFRGADCNGSSYGAFLAIPE